MAFLYKCDHFVAQLSITEAHIEPCRTPIMKGFLEIV